VEALEWSRRFALENKVVAHWLHAEHAHIVLKQDRQHFSFEAVEVRIHYVQRHLDGVEPEPMLGSGVQHLQMDVRTLVAGESDVTDLACFLRL